MIAEKTGWTDNYIMWGITWINIRMMLADAPGMTKKNKEVIEITGDELARKMGLM